MGSPRRKCEEDNIIMLKMLNLTFFFKCFPILLLKSLLSVCVQLVKQQFTCERSIGLAYIFKGVVIIVPNGYKM